MADTIKAIFQDVKNGRISTEEAKRRANSLDDSELTRAKFDLAVSSVGLLLSTAAVIIDPTKLSATSFVASTVSFERSAAAIMDSASDSNLQSVDIFAAQD